MPKLHPFRSITAAAAIGLLLLHAPITAAAAERDDGTGTEHDDHGTPPAIIPGTEGRLCESGIASGFPCRNVELLSRVPLEDLGGTFGNDVWGWSLSEASCAALGCPEPREARFALMGLSNGVAFVDVTVPEQARVRGFLPTVGDSSTWRDIKVYRDHAYIVADNNPEHALQVFDLAQLLEPWEGAQPQQFEASYRYTEFGSAHNIAINEDSGFAFVVGSDTCAGGLHMLDLTEPAVPAFAGCFDGDGYTHDVHCVTYSGPQEAFSGRELCFASNEDSLTITDVSNKQAPVLISKLGYPNVAYTHQGWLSDDHRWFVLGDELDELNTGANARTLVFDVSNPGEPAFAGAHAGASNTIDHNLYLRGNYVFQANYTAGLRILLAEDFGTARFREVGYFDTAPESEERQFRGAWSVYPFFDNGTILVSDMQAGLFVLRAELAAAENAPINGRLSGAYASPMLPDQGMTITVGENDAGPFIFVAWFLFLDGEPLWIVGTSAFDYGVSTVDIPMQRLRGPGFLNPDDGPAERIDIGNLNLHAHSCNAVHLLYDFGELGAGEGHMESLAGVQGRECPPSQYYESKPMNMSPR